MTMLLKPVFIYLTRSQFTQGRNYNLRNSQSELY